MSGFTNFRILSLTFLRDFSADQKWQTKLAMLISLNKMLDSPKMIDQNDGADIFFQKMSDFRKNDRTFQKSQSLISGAQKWSFCIFGNDFRFYLSTMPKQLAVRSFEVILTTYKGHLWGQQWVIHLYTSLRLFLWWSILFNSSFFRSEDKNARSGQVATPKNSGAPPLGRTLLKHLYKYLKIWIKNFTKFHS